MRTARNDEPVSVLHRVLVILEAVRIAGGSCSVSSIAARTRIPKSSVSRLVAELVRQRYLVRDAAGVSIGLRLFELGARASSPRLLGAAARPVLAELSRATGEHLNLAVRDGADMLSVVAVPGRLRPLPSRAGARVPSVSTALGKAVLAYASEDDLLPITAGLTPGARVTYLRELADVRRCTVAVDHCATFAGVIAVASPVLGRDRAPIAAISVSGPAADMDPDRMAPLIREAARTLSHRLDARVA
ncbi:IclR family transcriptional regulator [Microbacterium sp. NPDC091313]